VSFGALTRDAGRPGTPSREAREAYRSALETDLSFRGSRPRGLARGRRRRLRWWPAVRRPRLTCGQEWR